MSHAVTVPSIYGLLAEFDTPTELVNACKAAYAEGYREMDAYSPFPIEEASEAIGFHKSAVPLIVLVGGIPSLVLFPNQRPCDSNGRISP